MRFARLHLFAVGTLAAVATLVPLASVASAEQTAADKCVKYWGQAVFNGTGFNHLVHIANACAATADCAVSTDVNPEAQKVEVGGNSETVINTFLGSPARTFTPRVKCTMRN